MNRCPSFFGVNIDTPAFEESLSDALTTVLNARAIENEVEASAAPAVEMFSMENFVSEILSYVELERYRKADLGWWSFPPRG